MTRRTKILHTYLLDLALPNNSIDALLDTTDSLWYCLDRYAQEHRFEAIQLLSLAKVNKIYRRVRRVQSHTQWVFVPNRWWSKTIEFLRHLPRLALLQVNHISFGNMMSAMLAKAVGAKVIIAFLNDYELSQYPVPLWFLKMSVNAFSNLVIVPTEVNKSKLRRTFSQNIIVLRHGIDPEQFKPLQQRPRVDDSLRLSYVGRITPDKNVDDIAKGVSLCRNKSKIHVDFVGHLYDASETFMQELRKTLQEQDVSYEFPGYISHSRLPEYLSQIDIFINMRKQEGFGKVFIEAMGCGKPIIGRKGSAGAEELIREKHNGFLVQDAEELARVIDRLFEDRPLLAQLGKNARACVEELYSYERVYETFSQICSELLPL